MFASRVDRRAISILVEISVVLLPSACERASTSDGDPTRGGAVWFVDAAQELGVDFTYEGGATGNRSLPEIMGGGVALFDADGDGDLDLFFPNGHRDLPQNHGSGTIVDRLFLNLRPDSTGFADRTEGSEIGCADYGMGTAVGDVDNDGDNDVLVTYLEGLRLYRNLGGGHFEDATTAWGLDVGGWCTSAAFLDYDRDGFLDLYVARYVDNDPKKRCTTKSSMPDYCGPLSFPPVHDVLLHNAGGRRFEDVSEQAGISGVRAAGLGVACGDFDEDGWIDVYVANDAYANQLWRNRQDGTFEDVALQMGAALNFSGHTEAGMGVIAADLDGDGSLDLLMTHLADETNTLYLNRGGGRGFRDWTGRSGMGPTGAPYTSFGVAAIDVELDGDLDIVIASGRVNRATAKEGSVPPEPWNEIVEPNQLHRNDGNACFTPVPELGGEFVSALEVSRGLAVGDIDDDGDVDLVLANIGSRARVYRNEAPHAGRWLRVRAVDPRLRRDAIGARITVTAGQRRFLRCIESGSSYLSSSDLRAHFGLGAVESVKSIEVAWPDGMRETFSCPRIDGDIELQRGAGSPVE